MESLRETIRKNIEMYIKTSQYNQAEIAQMLGISKASVTNWIKGTNSPNIEYLDKLCDIFNIQINDIFERHENKETEIQGTTIEKYFIAQKIERAKELLEYDELNLNEIALTLNYSSAAHLSAQFKAYTGLTPRQYKQQKADLRIPLNKL